MSAFRFPEVEDQTRWVIRIWVKGEPSHFEDIFFRGLRDAGIASAEKIIAERTKRDQKPWRHHVFCIDWPGTPAIGKKPESKPWDPFNYGWPKGSEPK